MTKPRRPVNGGTRSRRAGPGRKGSVHDAGVPLTIGGDAVQPGERKRIDVPIADPYGHARVSLPVIVDRGRKPGPCLFVSAAIHGDELNGVEIVRRILATPAVRRIAGSLIAIPTVNVYGFLAQSRYLPDRRDLNRAFPGSEKGSLAARLAHVFMREVVANATHGLDLHTASSHRTNLPQVRACLDDAETARLARAFDAPVILNAKLRDGSLRQAVVDLDRPMLLYEAGEALRFDEVAIRVGVRGTLNVMRAIGMLPAAKGKPAVRRGNGPVRALSSHWIRAPESGVLRTATVLGTRVRQRMPLGVISHPAGEREIAVRARATGIVIGRTNLPLVNEGDALFHVATFARPSTASEAIETARDELDPDTGPSPSGEPPIQ